MNEAIMENMKGADAHPRDMSGMSGAQGADAHPRDMSDAQGADAHMSTEELLPEEDGHGDQCNICMGDALLLQPSLGHCEVPKVNRKSSSKGEAHRSKSRGVRACGKESCCTYHFNNIGEDFPELQTGTPGEDRHFTAEETRVLYEEARQQVRIEAKFKDVADETVCKFFGLNEQDESINVLPDEEP